MNAGELILFLLFVINHDFDSFHSSAIHSFISFIDWLVDWLVGWLVGEWMVSELNESKKKKKSEK